MKIEQILTLNRRQALEHIDYLDEVYYKLKNRKVCRVCPADITTMLNELKAEYMNKAEYRLKRERASYKVSNGIYISNDKMTNELAEEFLLGNTDRIELFLEAPADWAERLIDSTVEAKEIEVVEEKEVPCKPCVRKSLENKTMTELKEEYPNIPVEFGQKKALFIDKIMIYKLENEE